MPLLMTNYGGSLGTGGDGGDPGDDDFDSVLLLADGETTGVDHSKYAHHTSFQGDADATGGKFTLDGAGDYVNWGDPPTDVFDLGSSDFTMELFAAALSATNVGQLVYFLTQFDTTGDQRGFIWRFRGDVSPKRIEFIRSTDGTSGTNAVILSVDWSPTAGTEYDLALERSGDTYRFYVDGVMQGSDTASGAIFNSSASFLLGWSDHAGGTPNWEGGCKVVRLTTVARYATDTSYTVPSLPLPIGDTGIFGKRAAPASWLWLNNPRAIAYDSKLAFSGIDRGSKVRVFEAASPYEDYASVIINTLTQDHHGSGALLRRASDSKILHHSSPVNGAAFYQALSSSANDGSAFGAATDLDASLGLNEYAFANLVQLTGEADDPVYQFFRATDGTDRHIYYSRSTDSGATWAAATKLLSNNGDNADNSPYLVPVANGTDRIDFVVSEGNPQNTVTSIYHMYYQASDGTWRDSAGNALTLPITVSTDLTQVYDGSSSRARLWDIAIDGSGNPVIVYTDSGTTTDHKYRYAKWNGSSWDDELIVSGGDKINANQQYNAGGICIDPDDTNVVYCSIEDGAGIHQIHRYTKSGTWSGEKLTTNMRPSFMPFVVPSINRLLYLNGRYVDHDDFFSSVVVADIS